MIWPPQKKKVSIECYCILGTVLGIGEKGNVI